MGECYWHGIPVDPDFGCWMCNKELIKQGIEPSVSNRVLKAREDALVYLKKLHERKVMCQRPVYVPLHVYLNLAGFPIADEAWKHAISIPLYPSLTEKEIEKVAAIVKEIF